MRIVHSSDTLVPKLQEYMDSILTAPKMWGSMEAVEMQFLLLVELEAYVRDPSTDVRSVVENYTKFLESMELSRPLFSHPRISEAKFTSVLKDFMVSSRNGKND